MLLVASCSENEVISNDSGNEVNVSFALQLPNDGPKTRTIGDGKTVDKLVYAVYDQAGEPLNVFGEGETKTNQKVENDVGFSSAKTVNITLAKGQTYQIAFWAQNSKCTAYTTTDLKNVTVNYAGDNNDEKRDAFFKTVEYTVNGTEPEPVVLKRPFAQLNVGVTEADWNAAVAAGFTVTQSSVTISNAATSINLLTGEVSSESEAKLTSSTILTETLNVGTESYKYLSMSYFLVNDGSEKGDKQQLIESLEFVFTNEDSTKSMTLTQGLTNVPVQRNYRTNIIGNILTGKIDFNITIDNDFEGDNIVNDDNALIPVIKVTDVASLKSAIENAEDDATIVMQPGRYVLDETIVITKSITILGPQAGVDPRPSKGSLRTNDENEAILTGDKGDPSNPTSQQAAKDAGWLASIFEIRANNVIIDGITFQRTYNHIIYSQTADPEGGDNRAYDITGLKIVNNIVKEGRGNEGIKVGRSINALVQKNYINDISFGGDAIEAYDVKGFRILDNEIDGCNSVNGAIRVSNKAGGEPGIVKGNLIKNTGYHFAISAEDGSSSVTIDNNTIINANTGGIFVYKNQSVSAESPTNIEITNNTISNYGTNPVQGEGYKEAYLREAASAIAVSYNLTEGVQPKVKIEGNTTTGGATDIPALCFGGGTYVANATTDMSKITISENTFEANAKVKYINTSINANTTKLITEM